MNTFFLISLLFVLILIALASQIRKAKNDKNTTHSTTPKSSPEDGFYQSSADDKHGIRLKSVDDNWVLNMYPKLTQLYDDYAEVTRSQHWFNCVELNPKHLSLLANVPRIKKLTTSSLDHYPTVFFYDDKKICFSSIAHFQKEKLLFFLPMDLLDHFSDSLSIAIDYRSSYNGLLDYRPHAGNVEPMIKFSGLNINKASSHINSVIKSSKGEIADMAWFEKHNLEYIYE